MLNTDCTIEYKIGQKVWWYDKYGKLHTGKIQMLMTENGTATAGIREDGSHTELAYTDTKYCWPLKWAAMFMFNVNCMFSALLTFIGWGLAWMVLEVIIYGRAEDRLVDNIVAIPVLIALYFMFKFREERNRLKNNK